MSFLNENDNSFAIYFSFIEQLIQYHNVLNDLLTMHFYPENFNNLFIQDIMENFLIQSFQNSEPTSKGLPQEIIQTLPKKEVVNDEGTCAICTESYKQNDSVLYLPCFHTFHILCAKQWFQLKTNCPLCRANVLELVRDKSGES